MTRKMTDAEKKSYKKVFPNLDVNRCDVSGEATPVYNCISWTVGVTSSWIWPGTSLSDFDKFYKSKGFVRSSNGPIAAWGNSSTAMTHGCVSGPGHGPRWESKCGQGLRIQHGLNELVSSTYGRVIAFYKKRARILDDATEFEMRLANAAKLQREEKVELRKEQSDALESVLENVDRDLRSQFEERFANWRETWNTPFTFFHSDPSFVKHTEEYVELVSMGPAILPLVVEKLVNSENFFALQLYDALEPNRSSVVDIDPDDDSIFEGEQGRAERTVKLWLSNL